MKNKNIAILAVVSLLSVSCATSKKDVKSNAKASQETQETAISEDDKNEFEYTFIEAIKQKMIGNQLAAVTLFSKCL